MMNKRKTLKKLTDLIDRHRSGKVNQCVIVDQIKQLWLTSSKTEDILVVVGFALLDMNESQQVIDIIQDAAQVMGETELIYQLSGKAALQLNMPEMAEKAFSKACMINPSEQTNYLHLAIAQAEKGDVDQAIELLTSTLQHFPEYAKMWDLLGTYLLEYRGDTENGRVFLKQAHELDSENADICHNLALSYHGLAEAKAYYQKAIKLTPENPQVAVSFALYLLPKCKFIGPKLFINMMDYYESRHAAQLGSVKFLTYEHSIPAIEDNPITDKTILILSEQGIGDELLFASFLPKLLKEAKKVFLLCDPRLEDAYARSFPEVEILSYVDDDRSGYKKRKIPSLDSVKAEIDNSIYLGSLMRYFVKKFDDFMEFKGAYLKIDSKLQAEFRSRLGSKSRPRFALSWKSQNIKGARKGLYLDTELLKKALSKIEADFYVIQYVYSEEEKNNLNSLSNVHFMNDIDFKNNIDANLALLSLMDASIGPVTTSQMLAYAVGCPMVVVTNAKSWIMQYHKETDNYAIFGTPVDFLNMSLSENSYEALEDILKPHMIG
ncbi:hypothetical protein QGN29_03045 [Temperatibacter marinus]|uniref:Tetratricopeptide repeat protein n=1 Tax=Temperatibacter marinus TaxID=1456591 RepID=A0AA52EEJ7_9PROT|nr:hypothetical protein [Temperatibacter marinus]WND03346.1 hypothetical protein QGN29_03045 [Temperatibacter marinus]